MRNPSAKWVLVLLMGVVYTRALCGQGDTFTLSIDASRSIRLIPPLQGLDNGPLCQRGIVDLSRYYKELGVRNIRLHDVPWTYDNAFDINYIFPKWDAAVDDPGNYNFNKPTSISTPSPR